jgi:hypothetical protein
MKLTLIDVYTLFGLSLRVLCVVGLRGGKVKATQEGRVPKGSRESVRLTK